jgi:hypothetical protein
MGTQYVGGFLDFLTGKRDISSAKCKSFQKPQANLPDTLVDLTGAPK